MAEGYLIESISKEAFIQIEDFKTRLIESLKAAEGLATATQKIKLPSELKTQFSETEKQAGKTKKVVSDYEKQVRSLENTQKKWMQSTNSVYRSEKKLKEEIRLGNKYRKDEITLATNAARAYDRLQAKYNIAYKRLQDLSAAGKENTAQFKRAQSVFAKYEARVTRADHAVKSFRRNVGNYPKTMGAATASLRNLMSAFGLFTGVFLFAQLMRNAVNSVRLFDASMQNIAGVMRTTRGEIKDLEETIIEVAGASVNTATQVAKLAEALVTLGKTKEEIKDLLEPVNNLSIGLETTGQDAAEFLVQTLNAFGAGSDEAGTYADTIAKIRTSTTLDFQKMRDSFQYLAPISKLLNKDLAYTGALIGVVADRGIKAEQAGRLLGTAQMKLATQNKTLMQGLEELNDMAKSAGSETETLAMATSLFGKNSAKVGVTLAGSIDKIAEYEESIRNSEGALDDLVNEQLKSLDAALKIVKSRWEEYILNSNDAGGASNKLITILSFLGDNLSTIVNTIIAVVGAWVLYKTALLAGTIITRAHTVALGIQNAVLIAARGGFLNLRLAVVAFSRALSITPLGLFATALGLIITAVVLLGKETEVTNKELNESLKAYEKQTKKTKELKNEIQQLKERYTTLSEEVKEDTEKQIELEAVMKRLVTLVPQAEREFDKFGKTIGLNTDDIDDYITELDKLTELNRDIETDKNTKALARNKAELKATTEALEGLAPKRIGDIGMVKKHGDELVRVLAAKGKTQSGEAFVALTNKEKAAVYEYTLGLRENIQAANDRLAVLRGGKTTAQELAEAEEKAAQSQKEQTFIIQKLRREIRGHNAEIKDLTKNGVEKLTEAQGDTIVKEREAIKTKQALIDKILGFTTATKKAQKAIKGTIDYYNQLIAIEEKSRDATATTAEEYEEFEKRIAILRFELQQLNGEYEKWLDSLAKPITEAEALKALKEELGKVKEEILKIEDIDEVDLDFIDEEEVDKMIAYAKALERVNNLVKKAFVDLGSVLGIQESTVNSLFDGIKNGFKDAGEAAQAFGALATDVVNELARAQNARIDEQIERLGQEKEIALAFAGESAEARAVIEERYQRRVNQLKEQQARNEKRAAIISAIINTATAVVKTFAELGFPAGIPAAALIGALGAAQVAIIASQPIPQFHQGVENFKGGRAKINEYRDEVVTTKEGKVLRPTGRNLLVDLPQGANVYSSEQAFQNSLNKQLGANGIDPVGASSMAHPFIIGSLGNSGLNAEDLKRALIETLGNRPVLDLNIDKSGITHTIHRQSTKAKVLNNRVNVKSIDV